MKNIVTAAKILFGLVLLTIAFFAIGRNDASVDPSAHSYGPSGTRVFIEVLRESGYKVVVTNNVRPTIDSKSLLLTIPIVNQTFEPGKDKVISNHLESGGKVVLAPISPSFDQVSLKAKTNPTPILVGDNKSVDISLSDLGTYMNWGPDSRTIPVYSHKNGTVAALGTARKGDFLEFSDALPITNRFVDQASNLPVYLGVIKAFYPAGTIVVYDALSGRSVSNGLLATIGAWLQLGWYQVLILFGVFSFMMGKRFGLPVFDRKLQVGQRELVDAIGTFWRLNQATEMAVASYLKDADRLIRTSLKLPMDAPQEDRDDLLPPELRTQLRQAEALTTTRYPTSVVVPMMRKLDKDIQKFVNDRSVSRTSSHRFR